jgi:hypothetical protein
VIESFLILVNMVDTMKNIHEIRCNMEWYWDMLDPVKGPDQIVTHVFSASLPNSEIYEFISLYA